MKAKTKTTQSSLNKGVLREGEQSKGFTNIGQVNYITQNRTNVNRANNGEIVVAPNTQFKRRFVY